MKAAEIVDWVERRIRLLGIRPPGAGDILEFANEQNDATSRSQTDLSMFSGQNGQVRHCSGRKLNIPRRYVKDVDATTTFLLPTEARPGSALFAERTTDNRKIRTLTVEEANRLFPDWEENTIEGLERYPIPLIIYDPQNITAPVYPIGFSTGDILRMEYVIKPRDMVFSIPTGVTTVTDEPWEGELPEFHRIIPQMVVFEIALALGDELVSQKARAFYNDAQQEMEEAVAYVRNQYAYPVSRVDVRQVRRYR